MTPPTLPKGEPRVSLSVPILLVALAFTLWICTRLFVDKPPASIIIGKIDATSFAGLRRGDTRVKVSSQLGNVSQPAGMAWRFGGTMLVYFDHFEGGGGGVRRPLRVGRIAGGSRPPCSTSWDKRNPRREQCLGRRPASSPVSSALWIGHPPPTDSVQIQSRTLPRRATLGLTFKGRRDLQSRQDSLVTQPRHRIGDSMRILDVGCGINKKPGAYRTRASPTRTRGSTNSPSDFRSGMCATKIEELCFERGARVTELDKPPARWRTAPALRRPEIAIP
jgi:hypothetical protein